MKVRKLRASDIPILREMAEKSGFPYPDLGTTEMEAVRVVAGDDDEPLAAVAAERIVQLYLWCGKFDRPLAKVHALKLLHEEMGAELKRLGYDEVNAFLPPSLAEKLGKRLEKSFGWAKNWPSWTRRL
jgi:hypothetical protein